MKKAFKLLLFIFCTYNVQGASGTDSTDFVMIFENATNAEFWRNKLSAREIEISYPSEARLWRLPLRIKFKLNNKWIEFKIPKDNPAKAIGVIGERTESIGACPNVLYEIPKEQDILQGKLLANGTFPNLIPWNQNAFLPQQPINAQKALKIYVLDTGIELGDRNLPVNPLLAPHLDMSAAWNFVEDNNLPKDDNGHGTAVTNIIVRYLHHLQGTPSKITPLKVLDKDGFGTAFNVIKAIDKATREEAHLINCSLVIQSSFFTFFKKPPLQFAIEKALEKHILIVAGAGNDSTNMECHKYYPASLPNDNILVVGASQSSNNSTDHYAQNEIASFSNYGKRSVDVFAPGRLIGTMGIGRIEQNQYIYGYQKCSGTSFATPIVTGLAALLMAQGKDIITVKNTIIQSVDIHYHFKRKCVSKGVINVPRALGQTNYSH